MSELTYQAIFWIFMFGNVLGVIVEGLWCLIRHGKWESHVVALWGPFNIVYGIGLAVFYTGDTLLREQEWFLRVAALALLASSAEYLCGLVMRIGLRMKAWDYSDHFLNIQGLISPKMTLVWGTLGFAFDRFLYKPTKKTLSYLTGFFWDSLCVVASVFAAINFSCTAVCVIRWANRHRGKPPLNRISRFIDRKYPDERMQKKFCEWSFIEKETADAI